MHKCITVDQFSIAMARLLANNDSGSNHQERSINLAESNLGANQEGFDHQESSICLAGYSGAHSNRVKQIPDGITNKNGINYTFLNLLGCVSKK